MSARYDGAFCYRVLWSAVGGHRGVRALIQLAWLTDDMLNASTRSGGMAARLK
jgi:hypothetical protein